MKRLSLSVATALALFGTPGCLPSLEDACVADGDCPAERTCVGGVCAPRPGLDAGGDGGPPDAEELGPDAVAPDRGREDGPSIDSGPVADADPPDDVGPRADAEPVADAGPIGDAGCVVQPSSCNQLDDDCDGRVDEQSEAVEGCPGVLGALAACDQAACQYECLPGTVAVDEDPSSGCRTPRECALDGDWLEIAAGFEKGADEAQQVVIAARDDRRFVAAYDILAERRQAVVRSFVFDVGAPDEVDELRLGQDRQGIEDHLIGLSAVAVGDRFVVAGRVDAEVGRPVHLMARDGAESILRRIATSWPQTPAMTVVDAPGPTLVTLIEGHLNRADPPLGSANADLWPEGNGADGFESAVVSGPRAVGPARNAAFVLPDGRVAMAGDVQGIGIDGQPRYALRVDQLAREQGIASSIESVVDGPIVGRISVASAVDGRVIVFAPVESDPPQLYWRTLRRDGGAFDGEPITWPWSGPPAQAQALALPGGPGAIYRIDGRLHIALPDPGFDDFAFEGRLPDARDDMRAFAARQVDGRTVEVAALHDTGDDGVILFGRYVCH